VPPLRICYLLKRFPRLSQTFVLNELLELERQGVGVTIVARSDSGESLAHGRLRELQAPVTYVGRDDADAFAEAVVATGAAHLHAHFATWGARAALAVHRRTGIPYSFTAHATDIYRAGLDLASLAERIAEARFVVTVSDANRAHLEGVLAAAGRRGTVRRIYNGLDPDALTPPAGPREPGLVASVGRLIEKKGFADLVAAMALLGSGSHALVAGEGPDRPTLEERIAALGLGDRVELCGAVTSEDALALIGRAEVFALPCVITPDGDRDALPTVILEAMALGTPCVSTDVNGVPEMLGADGRAGLIVPQRDPAALAAAIDRLQADPELRARVGAAARARMRQRFDIRRTVGELRERFEAA